jgi:hypothetical protein
MSVGCVCDSPRYDRAVANQLAELAWAAEGKNWGPDTTLSGSAFTLPEPEVGTVWTRTESEDYKLPEDVRASHAHALYFLYVGWRSVWELPMRCLPMRCLLMC